jgi:ABC-2 type transport system ATP-binding protein
LVPAGDRSFYLRLSGLENLLFFGRLQGLRKRAARERALVAISDVGLGDAARQPVGVYSHGMQKRLSVARALLTKPALLLVDEATHDLDPVGARDARDLIQRLAEGGTTVIWATQRLDEIRGFAHGVTLIDRGQTRFQGSVAELMAHAVPRHYLLRLRNGRASGGRLRQELEGVLAGRAALQPVTDSGSDHYLMTLADGVILGEALAGIHAANVEIISCQEERSEIEEAFLSLTRKSGT